MKKYFLCDPANPNGGIEINVKNDDNCVFCKYCTGVFWDYTNLVYMIFCELEEEHLEMTCSKFEEEEPK